MSRDREFPERPSINDARTALLLAALTDLFVVVGFMLGGAAGMVIALALALAVNLIAYLNSGAMARRMFGVLEVDKRTAPGLVGIVEWVADRAGLPMPRVYVIGADQPNAFATGRNPENAAVAVMTGLLRALEKLDGAARRADNPAAERNPATAHMFIVNPLRAQRGYSLFSTHPPMEERIRRLMRAPAPPGTGTSYRRKKRRPRTAAQGTLEECKRE